MESSAKLHSSVDRTDPWATPQSNFSHKLKLWLIFVGKNVLSKSINTPPPKPLLSKNFLHFSFNGYKCNCVLKPLLKPQNKVIKIVYINIYLFLHKFSKVFRNTRQDTDWFVVFFIEKIFLLNNSVIYASFKSSGKLSAIKHSLKRFCKVFAAVLGLTFISLGGIVFQ